MTRYIDEDVVDGNIIVGRYKKIILVSEIESDRSKLLEALEGAETFVRFRKYYDFCEEYPFMAEKLQDDSKKEALHIKGPIEILKRYFYDGLPPSLAKVFDDFYRQDKERI